MKTFEVVSCEACGGPLNLLGQLGSLSHYRCRNCGVDASSETPPDDVEDTDDDGA